MNFDFSKKVILITGASSGIGKAVAVKFSKSKTSIVLVDIDEKKGMETFEEIQQINKNVFFIKADVTNIEDCEKMVALTIKKFNKLDIAFNNAGIINTNRTKLAEISLDEWHKVINVNLHGVFYSMKYQIPRMLNNKNGGVIINNASVLGLVGIKSSSPYVTSKHAVVGLTKATAIDYANKGIRINAICPGFIETSMLEEIGFLKNQNLNVYEKIASLHPIKRMGTANEIASSVLWLASDESSFITGAAIPVDGGYTSW